MNAGISIRQCTERDIAGVAGVEQDVWRSIGAPPLTHEEVRSWFDERSPFFLVAYDTDDERIMYGYYYGKIIMFSPEDARTFSDPSTRTSSGYCTHAHMPGGNTLYGMNVVSTRKGAGKMLTSAVNGIAKDLGLRYLVGFSRLAGFDRYATGIERSCGSLPCSSDETAAWYVTESARLSDVPCHLPVRSSSEGELPPLATPDPVLDFHIRGTPFEVLAVVPKYIVPDPQSRNYGALILSDLRRLSYP